MTHVQCAREEGLEYHHLFKSADGAEPNIIVASRKGNRLPLAKASTHCAKEFFITLRQAYLFESSRIECWGGIGGQL